MIVCFEGAPATGKTSLALSYAEHGAHRIAEVNELYVRPIKADKYWYLEQQIKRWSEATIANELAILDGDIFQPVWFNWMYPERTILTWQDSLEFFKQNAPRIGVPHQYVFLWVNEEERVAREFARSLSQGRSHERARAKAEKYKIMGRLEQAYFEAMAKFFPGLVKIRQLKRLGIPDTLNARFSPPDIIDYLDFLKDWLASNHPAAILEDKA